MFLLSAFPAKSFANILWFFFPPPKNILNMKSIFVGIMLPSNPKRTMTMCSIDFFLICINHTVNHGIILGSRSSVAAQVKMRNGITKGYCVSAMSVLSFQWAHGVLIQSCHLLLSHVERQKPNLSDVIFHWVSGGSPGSTPLNPESLH